VYKLGESVSSRVVGEERDTWRGEDAAVILEAKEAATCKGKKRSNQRYHSNILEGYWKRPYTPSR
jgi:hypothetical protein